MKRFLRSFRLAWATTRYVPAPEWTPADQRTLGSFLASPTGQRFAANLRNLTFRHLVSAVGESNQLQYNCGFATGFRSAVTAIESLAPTPSTDSTDLSDELDHLSP